MQLVKTTRNAAVIHADDRLRPRPDESLGLLDVDSKVVLADIAEDRLPPTRPDRLKVTDVVERRGDDLVTRSHVGKKHREMQGRGSRVHSHHVSATGLQVVGEPLLEVSHVGPHPQPAEL